MMMFTRRLSAVCQLLSPKAVKVDSITHGSRQEGSLGCFENPPFNSNVHVGLAVDAEQVVTIATAHISGTPLFKSLPMPSILLLVLEKLSLPLMQINSFEIKSYLEANGNSKLPLAVLVCSVLRKTRRCDDSVHVSVKASPTCLCEWWKARFRWGHIYGRPWRMNIYK